MSFGLAKLFLAAQTMVNQQKESSEHPEAGDVAKDHAEPRRIIGDDTHADYAHQPANSEQDHQSHEYSEQHQQRL